MLSGSIKLYDETPTYPPTRYAYGDYSYEPPANFQEELDKEIEHALKRGFHIGKKVKRVWGSTDQVGVVKHFNKTTKAFNEYSSKIEVLQIEWNASPSYKYDAAYHPDELKLVEEEIV